MSHLLDERENRPQAHHRGPAQSISSANSIAAPTLPPEHRATHDDTAELSEQALARAHAVLVWTPEGKYKRRLYFGLPAADRAMERAHARGLTSSCVMVELVPVAGVPIIVVGGEDR